jgi:DNA polymerase III epsilon subunit-like protein
MIEVKRLEFCSLLLRANNKYPHFAHCYLNAKICALNFKRKKYYGTVSFKYRFLKTLKIRKQFTGVKEVIYFITLLETRYISTEWTIILAET